MFHNYLLYEEKFEQSVKEDKGLIAAVDKLVS